MVNMHQKLVYIVASDAFYGNCYLQWINDTKYVEWEYLQK